MMMHVKIRFLVTEEIGAGVKWCLVVIFVLSLYLRLLVSCVVLLLFSGLFAVVGRGFLCPLPLDKGHKCH